MLSGRLLYCLIFLLSGMLLPVEGQEHAQVMLIPVSTLKITGLTNINSFSLTCLAKSNAIQVFPDITESGMKNFRDYMVDMILPLNGFESDNPIIKRDFLDLVKEKRYPTMHIYIAHICINSTTQARKDSITNVAITIGGVTRNYAIRFHTSSSGKEVLTSGHQKVNIRDFQLEPPRKFFGMVQVKEIIDIDFQLLLSPVSEKNS